MRFISDLVSRVPLPVNLKIGAGEMGSLGFLRPPPAEVPDFPELEFREVREREGSLMISGFVRMTGSGRARVGGGVKSSEKPLSNTSSVELGEVFPERKDSIREFTRCWVRLVLVVEEDWEVFVL